MKLCFLVILCLIIQAPFISSQSLVIELFRHGARSPSQGTFDNSWDSYGYGELTSVGMRQHYILGAAISQTYPTLTPYDPTTVYVRSCDKNRTIMSAYCHLYGVYNGLGPNLPDTISHQMTWPPYDPDILAQVDTNNASALPNNFMPVPIHSVDSGEDYILESYKNCPDLSDIYYAHTDDDTVNEVFQELNSTVSYINSQLPNQPIKTMKDLKNFGDTAIANLYYGKTIPANIQPSSPMFNDIVFADQWYEVYPTLATKKQRQTFVAPLMWQINDYINGVKNGSSSLKFIVLSAHETTLMLILTGIGLVTPECLRANWEAIRQDNAVPYPLCSYPIFASQIVFEYYNTTDPYIVVKYNDMVIDFCNTGNGICSLNEFINVSSAITGKMGYADFLKVCGITTPNQQTTNFFTNSPVLPICLSGLILVLLTVLIVLVRKKDAKERLLEAHLNEQAQKP